MVEKISWEQIGAKGNNLLSPAYKSNGHVFLSGQVGQTSSGEIPTDVEAQTEIAIANFKKVLANSGSSIDRVLKVLLFIGHPSYAPIVNKVYLKHFTTQPARSCIVVAFPNPNIKVELEGIAQYESYKGKL